MVTVNQELLPDTKHVQEQKCAIMLTLFGRPPRDIDKTTLQQPQRVGALLCCHPRHQSTSVGPCKNTHGTPRGKVVGGPQHDPQCDKRAQPKDRLHCLQQRTCRRIEHCIAMCAWFREALAPCSWSRNFPGALPFACVLKYPVQTLVVQNVSQTLHFLMRGLDIHI